MVLLKVVSINEFREVPNFYGYVMEHGHGGSSGGGEGSDGSDHCMGSVA